MSNKTEVNIGDFRGQPCAIIEREGGTLVRLNNWSNLRTGAGYTPAIVVSKRKQVLWATEEIDRFRLLCRAIAEGLI